jgi:FkbM family methyltransferase
MELYDHKNGSGIFVQIGAGAGDLDIGTGCRDGFSEFVKQIPRDRIKKIILVEPNPINIPLLKECWKDYPEAVIYEIGIVPRNYPLNKLEFFYCPTNGPHYQVASIKPQHIYKHFGDCELIKLLIDVKHLETFINEITTDEIELLSLDIEGLDAEVILDIDFTKIKIKHLSFEYVHLGNREQEVRTYLIDNNLKYLGSGVDHGGNDYLYIKNTP